MFVVAGVSGNTGAVTARTLLERRQPVRAIVRDAKQGEPWRRLGAEVAVGTLDDAAFLAKAFAGAQGAYLLSPPDPKTTDLTALRTPMFEAIARAAREAKLPHLVLLSSIGGQLERGNGPVASLHVAERILGAATALTALRAAYFLENWGAVLPAARQDGVLPSFIPEGLALPTVAIPDVGRAAAEALLGGPKGRQVIELAGPTDPTPADVAAALTKLLGRAVKVQVAPPAAAVGAFQSFGFSEHMSRLYAEMYEGFVKGTLRWEGKPVRGEVSLEAGLSRLLG